MHSQYTYTPPGDQTALFKGLLVRSTACRWVIHGGTPVPLITKMSC